jgi:cytochrome c553
MKKVAIAMLFAGSTLLMADGAALYAKCAGCHGKDGKTKALGKSDPIAGLAADVLVKDLEGYKAGTTNKHGMGGVMKGQVATYSADDIKAVAAYINGLK